MPTAHTSLHRTFLKAYREFLLILAVAFVATTAAKGQQSVCPYSDANHYWMWERYAGIRNLRDVGGQREWVELSHPTNCYRTPLKDIKLPGTRHWGYRLAIEEWFKALPFNVKDWDKPEIVAVRAKMDALLGRKFASLVELQSWWMENKDYLAWSEAAQTLVVDQEAKAAKRPITTRDAERPISAFDYWKYDAMGFLSHIVDDGLYVHGRAWTSDHHHPEVRFRILRAVLHDRTVKESAYRAAVASMVGSLAIPELGRESSQEIRLALMRVTGKTFAENKAWVTWWRISETSAHLNPEGTRLVTE